jgi:hypothetical protein
MGTLRRTCAVLSLVTGHLWVPLSRLHWRGAHEPPVAVPAFAGVPGTYALGVTVGARWTGAGAPRETFTVPGWAVHAIEHLGTDGGLDTAVHAHYEAMRLDIDGYSSAAHLGYVAAIEGYGMRLVPDEICDCEAHGPHPRGVAEKRFRAALRTVMSNRQVKALADGVAYDLRSLTGHRGTLHGEEPTLGHPVITMFRAPAADVFAAAPLAEMRQASREVPIKALQDQAAADRPGEREGPG